MMRNRSQQSKFGNNHWIRGNVIARIGPSSSATASFTSESLPRISRYFTCWRQAWRMTYCHCFQICYLAETKRAEWVPGSWSFRASWTLILFFPYSSTQFRWEALLTKIYACSPHYRPIPSRWTEQGWSFNLIGQFQHAMTRWVSRAWSPPSSGAYTYTI